MYYINYINNYIKNSHFKKQQIYPIINNSLEKYISYPFCKWSYNPSIFNRIYNYQYANTIFNPLLITNDENIIDENANIDENASINQLITNIGIGASIGAIIGVSIVIGASIHNIFKL